VSFHPASSHRPGKEARGSPLPAAVPPGLLRSGDGSARLVRGSGWPEVAAAAAWRWVAQGRWWRRPPGPDLGPSGLIWGWAGQALAVLYHLRRPERWLGLGMEGRRRAYCSAALGASRARGLGRARRAWFAPDAASGR
jgi:hypothetical protein